MYCRKQSTYNTLAGRTALLPSINARGLHTVLKNKWGLVCISSFPSWNYFLSPWKMDQKVRRKEITGARHMPNLHLIFITTGLRYMVGIYKTN